jgi:hypothetical protein
MNINLETLDALTQYYVDKWVSIADQMKDLSTLSPDAVFFTTAGDGRGFLRALGSFVNADLYDLKGTLDKDADNLIGQNKLFDNADGEDNLNAFNGISAFYSARMALDRVYAAYKRYLRHVETTEDYVPDPFGTREVTPCNRKALLAFYKSLLFPTTVVESQETVAITNPAKNPHARAPRLLPGVSEKPSPIDDHAGAYHTSAVTGVSNLLTTADLVRRIYVESLHQHLNEMIVENIPRDVNTVDRKMPIVSGNARVDDLVKYITLLDSFPVVPEDLAGNVFPTYSEDDGNKNRPLTEPGAASSHHLTTTTHDRVCSRCQLHFTTLGQTDEIEQRTRFTCTCTYRDIKPTSTPAVAAESANKAAVAASVEFIDSASNDTLNTVLLDTQSTSEQLREAWSDTSHRDRTKTLHMMSINFEHLDKFKNTRTTRALSLTRVVCAYNRSADDRGQLQNVGGCRCVYHTSLFKEATAKNKQVFDKIATFQKRYLSPGDIDKRRK